MDDFVQSLPTDRAWKLLAGDKHSFNLAYQDEAGNVLYVPNIWYNQPVEWRIEAQRYYARNNLTRSKFLRQRPMDFLTRMSARDSLLNARRLYALAREMERTGKVLA